ncbi:ABC transporter permease [Eubacteriales bacterium OttesenSCG-928-N13]|nr:ABC transporter permease [Eubacteriales bacterium OttesenSCG-928-N13]
MNFAPTPEMLLPATQEEREQLIRMRESTTYWKDAMRRFRRNKVAMACAILIVVILLFAWVGPFLMPYSYDVGIRGQERMGPSLDPFHPFGTDNLGRDLMVRVMIATRISLSIGIVASLFILIIGTLYGAISGFIGGWVDNVMMRIAEVFYSIPSTLIIILLNIALKPHLTRLLDSNAFFQPLRSVGPGLICMFLTFALLYWFRMARIVRGDILTLKNSEYVTASRALGGGSRWIIGKHLIPNCVGSIVITTTFEIPSAIFTESFLSFIGLGVSAPMASLGSMVNDALNGFQSYPYRLVIPATMIALIILAFNQLGDGLRDALDPRMRD